MRGAIHPDLGTGFGKAGSFLTPPAGPLFVLLFASVAAPTMAGLARQTN